MAYKIKTKWFDRNGLSYIDEPRDLVENPFFTEENAYECAISCAEEKLDDLSTDEYAYPFEKDIDDAEDIRYEMIKDEANHAVNINYSITDYSGNEIESGSVVSYFLEKTEAYKVEMKCYNPDGSFYFDEPTYNGPFFTKKQAYKFALFCAEDELKCLDGTDDGQLPDKGVSFGIVESPHKNNITINYYYLEGDTDTTGYTTPVTIYSVVDE